jgi:hypothetical protein
MYGPRGRYFEIQKEERAKPSAGGRIALYFCFVNFVNKGPSLSLSSSESTSFISKSSSLTNLLLDLFVKKHTKQ